MQRESVVPQVFRWVLLAKGAMALTRAAWRQRPAFITGQAFGLIVDLRKVLLIRASARAGASN